MAILLVPIAPFLVLYLVHILISQYKKAHFFKTLKKPTTPCENNITTGNKLFIAFKLLMSTHMLDPELVLQRFLAGRMVAAPPALAGRTHNRRDSNI